MKLFSAIPLRSIDADTCVLNGYSIVVEPKGLAIIVGILTAFGFVVHIADRVIFG